MTGLPYDIIRLIIKHAEALSSDLIANQPHHVTLLDALITIAKAYPTGQQEEGKAFRK